MRDPGAGLGQHLDLTPVHVDAVGGDGARTEETCLVQSVDDALAGLTQTVFLVGHVLGGVDVESQARFGGGGDAVGERLVRQGQGGVEAEGGSNLGFGLWALGFREAHVFGDAGLRPLRPIPVGDLIAEADPQPCLLHRLGDDVERALDGVGAGVMINQRGRAVANRIHQADQR